MQKSLIAGLSGAAILSLASLCASPIAQSASAAVIGAHTIILAQAASDENKDSQSGVQPKQSNQGNVDDDDDEDHS